jgi:hypothetical protein
MVPTISNINWTPWWLHKIHPSLMSKGEIICNYLVIKSKFKFEYESENSPPNHNDDGSDND